MLKVREKQAAISVHDSVERFTNLGVDVFLAKGKFIEPGIITAGESILHYRKAVIATGARAGSPPIPGLADTPHFNNETLFAESLVQYRNPWP